MTREKKKQESAGTSLFKAVKSGEETKRRRQVKTVKESQETLTKMNEEQQIRKYQQELRV